MSDPSAPRWPSGYHGRSATAADTAAVHRLVGAYERALHGRVTTGAERVAADLDLSGREPSCDAVLVHDRAGNPAAWGWVRGRRATVHVHPDHRGRGLGGCLLAWTEARARHLGGDRLAQTVSDEDAAATALLRSGGYARLVTEWLLEIALPAAPAVPEPPAGITVRAFRPGDEEAAYRLTEDAFDEWQQRRKTYPEWARHTVGRSTFTPAASPLAFADGELVGALLSLDAPDGGEGYVERLAVHRDHRGRGIARLLLHEAFRAFHHRGRRACTLWTHSDTGALPLYQHLGMTVRRSSTVYGRALVAG
ncbi:GNAT family N-acetyltransferase [Streptomyces misionensis]|uniref:GNAT family N-acetyltransferase n=1 Tax=Streptomyces misionensis TaxID=67331 RepID=A0A5C6JZM9_9ACTN|nr:GNAT family N-acetyltransferase [Streptomyces misionensis]TWV55773.1 GNAT family N-acetyltransferase [Streptomyces misionensis]